MSRSLHRRGPGGALTGLASGSVHDGSTGSMPWRSELDEIAPGRFAVLVRAGVVGARAAATGAFRARVRDAHGGWIVLHASRLVAGEGDGEIVVTVDRASGAEVPAGRPTADIAGRLAISAHTVQDHLKSVFGKVGVRSRGELTAALLS